MENKSKKLEDTDEEIRIVVNAIVGAVSKEDVEDATEHLISLYRSKIKEIISEIVGRLPKKRTWRFDKKTLMFEPSLTQQEKDGYYNQALDEVLQILKEYRE